MISRSSRALVLCAFTVFSGISHSADSPAPLFESSTSESIIITRDPETSAARTQQVSVNYHQLYLMMPKERELIARDTITKGYVESSEGESATAQVDLFYRQSNGSYSKAPDHGTTVAEASEVKFNSDHWTATIFGCCDAEPLTQLFAYGESTPFLYANSKYAQVILPNASITRYIGVVLRSQTPTDDLEQKIFGNGDAMAAILYAAPGKPLQKLFLHRKPGVRDDDVPYHTLNLDLKSKSSRDEDSYNDDDNISKVLTMWSLDSEPGKPAPKTISGLTIVASFSGSDGNPEKVSIPVENDKFGTPKLTGQTMKAVSEKLQSAVE